MTITKFTLLTVATASCLAPLSSARAAYVQHALSANAPAHCQAFTPGLANTIRNRVVGSENVGETTNVACAFEVVSSMSSSDIDDVELYFTNNTSGTISVSCTLLTGFQGMAGAVVVNGSAEIPTGQWREMLFDPADMGKLVGVNCKLPKGAVINESYVSWGDENGVDA